MARLGISLLPLLMAMGGCVRVGQGDLAGEWRLRAESRQYLPPNSSALNASLCLSPEGTFSGRNLPGGLLGNTRGEVVVTGKGTWRLASDATRQEVWLSFREIAQETADLGTPLIVSSVPRVVLYYFDDDPDLARRVEFERAGGCH